MWILILGCLLFFGVHSLAMVYPALRERFTARYGANPWQGLYSLIAAIGLALMIYGYGAARVDSAWLYSPPTWSRHAAFALMLPVFVLLAAAYIPGRIRQRLGHPMLMAVVLWSAAHLLANGRVADVVLFGSFLVWSLLDWLSMAWRSERAIRHLPSGKWNDAIAMVLGLAAYVLFAFYLHGWVTGVPLV